LLTSHTPEQRRDLVGRVPPGTGRSGLLGGLVAAGGLHRGDGLGGGHLRLRVDVFLDSHVQLLLDHVGADRREADDERDHLEVLRLAQQGERIADADPGLLARRGDAGQLHVPPVLEDVEHDAHAHREQRRAHEQQVRRAHHLRELQQAGAHDPAKARSAADEPEDAFGLPRVEDVVGERPELADEEDAEDQAEEVERRRHPPGPRLEPDPEEHQDGDQAGLGDRDGPAPRHLRDRRAVALHDEADRHPRHQRDVGQVVGAEIADELRPRDRLQDVPHRHGEERVREHQERDDDFLVAQFHDGPQQAFEHGVYPEEPDGTLNPTSTPEAGQTGPAPLG
jgi:hypothetical protein